MAIRLSEIPDTQPIRLSDIPDEEQKPVVRLSDIPDIQPSGPSFASPATGVPAQPSGVPTIGPQRPISPAEVLRGFFRPQIEAARTVLNPQANIVDRAMAIPKIVGTANPVLPYQDNVMGLVNLPGAVATDQLINAAQGTPRPGVSSVRQALAGFPYDDRERQAMRGLTQGALELGTLGAIPPAAEAVTQLGRTAADLPPVAKAAEAIQKRLPITVEEAERIVRSGKPPAGFAKRVSQLSLPERQELARRLGQVRTVTPAVPEIQRLPAPGTPAARPRPAVVEPPAPSPTAEIRTLLNKTIDVPDAVVPEGKIPVRYEGEQEGLGALVTELTPVGEGKFRLGSTKVYRPGQHEIVASRAGKATPPPSQVPVDPKVVAAQPSGELPSTPMPNSPEAPASAIEPKPVIPPEQTLTPEAPKVEVAKSVQEAPQTGRVEQAAESAYAASRYKVERLYHETSPDTAVEIATGIGDKAGLQVSPEPSLALGQSGKGALIEFGNVNQIDVQPMRSKPGTAFVEGTTGAPPEMRILKAPTEGNRIVASVTFKPGAGISNVSKMRMERWGWTKETLPDGSVKFTNPAIARKAQPSPQPPSPDKEPLSGEPKQGELFQEASKKDLIIQQGGAAVPSTFQTEADKVRAILDKHGIQDVVIKLVDAIETPSGGKAVGSFVPGQGVVKLTPKPLSTTGYHEAFHVLVRRAGVGSDLGEALNEMRSKFGARSVQEAEEILADEFARYANQETSDKWSDKLKRFFQKVMDAIKRLFGKDSRARRLFDELLNPTARAGEAQPLGGEVFQAAKPRNLTALAEIRRRSIAAVMRDLREQAIQLNQGRIELRRLVLQSGGIKPTVGGQLREELQAIRPYLRNNGQPIDVLATELGYEDGEALREALITARRADIPSMRELRAQAERIVDSEQGNLILQAVSSEKAGSAAIKRAVRDVGRQVDKEMAAAQREIERILEAGKRKGMTPAQMARFARLQRVQPGETTLGPRGGTREAPLSDADIRRVEATTEGIVPPRGQPTGTPPKIPTGKALIRADYAEYPFKDLNELQSTPFSGLDPHRAAELIDGKPFGPTTKEVVQPIRRGELEKRKEHAALLQKLRQVSGHMKRKSQASSMVADYIEGNWPKGKAVPEPIKRTADWMRSQYDDLLNRVNAARQAAGKRPILARKDYMTHLSEASFWTELADAFSNTAEAKIADEVRAVLKSKTPFFRFGLPRQGGEYSKDAIRAFETYIDAALRVIHMTGPGKQASAFIRNLPPNAQRYYNLYLDKTVAGKLGWLARYVPGFVRRRYMWAKAQFAKGTILGNISSVAMQPWTVPYTVSATGPIKATKAAQWMAFGDGVDFAERFSEVMQGRIFELDLAHRGLRTTVEDMLGWAMESADRMFVAHAFLSGYIDAVDKGAGIAEAIAAGDRIAQRTQAGFLEADLPPIFQDEILSGFVQFQNTVNGAFNYVKFDALGGRMGNPAYRIALLLGGIAAMTGIYDALGIPRPRLSEGDYIPGMSNLRGGPIPLQLTQAAVNMASNDPRKRAEGQRKFGRIIVSVVPGGNQAYKSISGLSAVSRGGVYDKRNRLRFPISGAGEQIRSVAFGPYQTNAGKAYVKRGFKPEPVSDEQKKQDKALKNLERSILGN